MGTLPRLTPEQQDDPDFLILPRYWVPEMEVETSSGQALGTGLAARLASNRPQLR